MPEIEITEMSMSYLLIDIDHTFDIFLGNRLPPTLSQLTDQVHLKLDSRLRWRIEWPQKLVTNC